METAIKWLVWDHPIFKTLPYHRTSLISEEKSVRKSKGNNWVEYYWDFDFMGDCIDKIIISFKKKPNIKHIILTYDGHIIYVNYTMFEKHLILNLSKLQLIYRDVDLRCIVEEDCNFRLFYKYVWMTDEEKKQINYNHYAIESKDKQNNKNRVVGFNYMIKIVIVLIVCHTIFQKN